MRTVLLIGMVVMVLLAGCTGMPGSDEDVDAGNGNGNGYGNGNGNGNGYGGNGNGNGGVSAGNGNGNTGNTQSVSTAQSQGVTESSGESEQVGYSVGGSSDVNNFRSNVREGYLPLASDMTSPGLYKEYYFDRGASEPCDSMFCPSYSQAITRDPFSGETEQYLTVGLNSGLEQSDFERPDLNLVVVVDVSGSMDNAFDSYYYDDDGERVETEQRNKMQAARESVNSLLDQLDEEDRVGIVSFADGARTVAAMERVGEREMSAVRNSVEQMHAGGGTNLEAGMRQAASMARAPANDLERQTRVVYVTDAMPNQEGTSASVLGGKLEDHAEEEIYSTFVGVGVDFNTELVHEITNTRGANYYSVQSARQFQERMDEGFDYMVTPLVFDLSLEVESAGYEISRVYGTNSPSMLDGDIMHVETLFPSKTEGGRTKGGVVLLKLADVGPQDDLEVTASYETAAGTVHVNTRNVHFETREPEYFDNTGIRKAVALARYTELTQNWIAYERARIEGGDPDEPGDGIDSETNPSLGEWERQSTDIQVSAVYGERFEQFAAYFEAELEAIGDDSLRRELDILRRLIQLGEQDNRMTALDPPPLRASASG